MASAVNEIPQTDRLGQAIWEVLSVTEVNYDYYETYGVSIHMQNSPELTYVQNVDVRKGDPVTKAFWAQQYQRT